MMKAKKTMTNMQKIATVVRSLSSNQHYFLINTYPLSDPQECSNNKNDQDLTILVYGNNDEQKLTTVTSRFLENLTEECPFTKAIAKKFKKKETETYEEFTERSTQFHLELGHFLHEGITIKELKKYLRSDNIDGLKLFINPKIHEENASLQFLQDEINYFSGSVQVPFILSPNKYTLYLPIKPSFKLKELKNCLAKEIQLVFGQMVNQKAIVIQVQDNGKWLMLDEKEEKRIAFFNVSEKVRFSVDDVDLVPPASQNSNFLVIKGEGIKLATFDYDNISRVKVIDLLNKIDSSHDWSDFGLMIGDFTLKSFDRIEKAGFLFKKSYIHSKHIVGVIIKEMHVFELQLKNIQKKGKVDIKSIVFDDKTNKEHQKTCEKEIERRANETTLANFKHDLSSIKPILLYTSQLEVCSSIKGTHQPMYHTLNQFLRTQHFCRVMEADYTKWEYLFGCELLQQLRKIPCLSDLQDPLWRGVSYPPSHKKGDIIQFKQFTSSSKSQSTAKEFAEQAIFKIVKSSSGRCIKEFSFYQYEDQILFQPYTYFKVIDIQKYENNFHSVIPCFVLEELMREKIPENIQKFVLWVDDKTGEGKQLWSELKGIKNTMLMLQLLSTEELKNWLSRNQPVLDEPTAEVFMITNMTRFENGIKNQEAGIDAIQIFKKYKPESPIFVYIGWVQGTIKKLQKHGLYPNPTISVSKYVQDLQEFLESMY